MGYWPRGKSLFDSRGAQVVSARGGGLRFRGDSSIPLLPLGVACFDWTMEILHPSEKHISYLMLVQYSTDIASGCPRCSLRRSEWRPVNIVAQRVRTSLGSPLMLAEYRSKLKTFAQSKDKAMEKWKQEISPPFPLRAIIIARDQHEQVVQASAVSALSRRMPGMRRKLILRVSAYSVLNLKCCGQEMNMAAPGYFINRHQRIT